MITDQVVPSRDHIVPIIYRNDVIPDQVNVIADQIDVIRDQDGVMISGIDASQDQIDASNGRLVPGVPGVERDLQA